MTTVLAWGAALGVCVAAVLFGQTARTSSWRCRLTRGRWLGLALWMSGRWVALLEAVGLGALTGEWLTAAAAAAAGTVVVAVAEGVLLPR